MPTSEARGQYPCGGGVFFEYVEQNILELLSFNTLYMERINIEIYVSRYVTITQLPYRNCKRKRGIYTHDTIKKIERK